jgi:hypothetical protein
MVRVYTFRGSTPGVTDENQTFKRDLGYRVGYLSVIASGLFLQIKAREEFTGSSHRQICV